MSTHIFIVHPSTIIQKGILSVLHTNFILDCQTFYSIKELLNKSKLNKKNILLILPAETEISTELNQFISQNNTSLIGISTNKNVKAKETFDLIIQMDDTEEQLILLFNQILNNNSNSALSGGSNELTERETDVLKLVASGFSNKEIAAQLFISTHTVISHRKNITEKLDIKSISGLTVYAILHRLISPDQLK